MAYVKTILVISTDLRTLGGVSRVVGMMLNSSIKEQYRLLHLCSHCDGSKFLKLLYQIRSYILFPWIMLTNQVDLIHVHGSMKISFLRKSYFVIMAKLLFRKKIIYQIHAAIIDEFIETCSPFKQRLIRRFFGMYDALIVISNYWVEVMRKYNPKIYVVYNPVEVPPTPMIRQEPRDKVIVFTFGEVSERKGSHDLIQVGKHFVGTNVEFHIAGNGPIDHYQAMAQENGVADVVKFLGPIRGAKNIEALFYQADIYCLPSYFEGLPISILEALSFALPVITTPVGGIPDTVIEGETGFLVPPGDIEAIRDRVNILAQSSELRQKMGAGSYQLACERFDISKIVNQLSVAYEDLMKTD